MRLTVIGVGYLGLTHAACMADLGHDVLAIDTDHERVARVSAGEMPFFEPGLESLLRKGLETGRLRFTTSQARTSASSVTCISCAWERRREPTARRTSAM